MQVVAAAGAALAQGVDVLVGVEQAHGHQAGPVGQGQVLPRLGQAQPAGLALGHHLVGRLVDEKAGVGGPVAVAAQAAAAALGQGEGAAVGQQALHLLGGHHPGLGL
jgi:hypothetical protein